MHCRSDNDDSDSDIDDDITLDECTEFMKHRKERLFTFTQLKEKSIENNSANSNLKKTVTNTFPAKESYSNKHLRICQLSESNDEYNENSVEDTIKQPLSMEDYSTTSNEYKVPGFNNVKKKRTILTAEERKINKELKENEKLERKKKRDEQKLQRELEKERQNAIKKAGIMASRSEKKEECMDRILAVVDPCLVEESGGGDILKDLQDMFAQYELKALPIVCCIGWMREDVEYNVDESNKVTKVVSYEEDANVIHRITACELATRIEAKINIKDEEETLIGLVNSLKKTFSKKKITIAVVGINAYHRLVKTKQNEEFHNKALGGQQPAIKRKKKDKLAPNITKQQIDEQLIKLQITTNICIRFCEDMPEFSKLISSFTKAIADAPFKKAPTSSLQFSTTTSNKVPFKISSDGHGISQIWNQQLQQFYGVRNDTSIAITQVYSTPLSLFKAYQNLSPSEGAKLLQDIEIRRGVGVLQTKRRVGPELSKKIHKLFTSENGYEALAK